MKWNSHNQGRGSEWTKCWLLIQENPAEGASRRGSCASPLLPWCWQNLMLYLVNVHSDTPAGNLIVDFFHQYPTRPQRFFFFFQQVNTHLVAELQNTTIKYTLIWDIRRHEYGVFESRSDMFQKTGKGKSHYHELLRISNEMTLTTDNKTLIASS